MSRVELTRTAHLHKGPFVDAEMQDVARSRAETIRG